QQLEKSAAALNTADMIFAHNDVMAAGAKKVIDRLKLKHDIKVVGIDALPGNGGGLQMVASNVLDASLLYPTGGKEAVVTAFRILNKESFSKDNILQSLVIDSTNVLLMKLQWNKISSQQKDIERQQSLLAEQDVLFRNQQMVLNITVITLVLAIVFGGLAFYSLLDNRKINKSLEAKNDQILSQRNQLIEMSAKAEMATEAKLNFFTNISHEFRTPLTLILSPLEDLLNNEKIKAVAGRNLNLIHKNAFRLLRLVNQLIEYRKIEYEKMQINASANNLIDFVKDILDSFQHSAQKRNIDLRLTNTEHNLIVWFDANMLDKVIFNLLSNALKFTAQNGKIQVFIRREDDQVYINVQDNGIGMTEDEAGHIFEHFYQANTNSTKGSGLGLSLSKELMRLHHGTIQVKSKKWEGTVFSLSLKTGSDHFNEEEKKKEDLNRPELYEQSKIYTTDLDEATVVENNDAMRSLKEQSVLIIEDNIDLLNYLSSKLSEQFEVHTANTGNGGIDSAYELVPDLIISDVVLPGATGSELTARLKSDIRTSHIPVILLTAKGSIEQQIHGIDSMADAYIVKPFNYDYLLANAKNLLKNRVLLKDHYTSDISPSTRLPVSKTLDKKFINDFAGIVEQNLSNENFNVDDICKAIGVSRVQLYRKVKVLLDCTITDYILNRRLKKAKYLLINENYSISEITYMVGFTTPNYFATVFKAKYGITPSEFKKNEIHK
ncbi:MAG: helix-turn-helix domain-containing protein, partial [Sphingobacteriaceae bacterium]